MADLGTFLTERLRVTDWASALADAPRRQALEVALADLLTPAVCAPLPPALQVSSPQAIPGWIDARAAESAVSLVRTAKGDLVGLLIRAVFEDTQHIGYLLAERVWGRGYASELLAGLVAARGAAPIALVAGVDASNAASRRVLEKAGFRLDAAASDAQSLIYTSRPRAD